MRGGRWWEVAALKAAFLCHGPPKPIISDPEGVSVSDVFAEFAGAVESQAALGRHRQAWLYHRLPARPCAICRRTG
jgi:hypothetical protein